MVNKYTVNYHPSLSELTSRIHPVIFLWTPKGFIFLECFLNFFSNLYIPPWCGKNYGVNGVKVTDKYICESENWICSFTHSPKPNYSQVLIITLQARNYPFLLNSTFLNSIFPSRKGRRRIMEQKKWLNLRGYWSQVLINSTIFATFTFLVSVLCAII